MKKFYNVIVIAAALLAAPAVAFCLSSGDPAGAGSDTLTWPVELYAQGSWADEDTSFSYDVSQNPDDSWHYAYSWQTTAKDLSHIIIEVTPEIFAYMNLTPGGTPEVGIYEEGGSNPGFPFGEMAGLKIDLTSDTTSFDFAFDSWNQPVWGNFYAKNGNEGGRDGVWNIAYNNFEDGYYIIRPNGPDNHVNEPATLLLFGTGLIGLAGVSRRKFMK